MNVVVLHGEVSPEAPLDEQDALIQVEVVSSALDDLGYSPFPIPFSTSKTLLKNNLDKIRPSFVFNLVESLDGKGEGIHRVPAFLHKQGIPFTGADETVFANSTDKIKAKKIMASAGIPTPDYFFKSSLMKRNIHGMFIIKPIRDDASIGIDDASVVRIETLDELFRGMAVLGQSTGLECFAERYIEGREFNCSLLSKNGEVRVLPCAEIIFQNFIDGKPKIVGYRAKWEQDSFEYKNTVRRFDFSPDDQPLLARLRELSILCWKTFKLKGYARVDFRVDEKGFPWVLEINANPCLSPDAGFMAAAKMDGMSMKDVVKEIVNDLCRA